MSDQPKIIVDSDWKSQARAEKERLAASEQKPAKAAPAPAAPGAAPAAPANEAGAPQPIQADFEELIRLLASQALLYMGAFPDPETGRAVVALDYARLNVDLLGLLEAKTKGNLTEQESSLLTRTLYELRMQYLEVAKAVAKAVEEGRVTRMAAGGAGEPRRPSAPPG
jgi:hypothetical protein